MHPRFSSSSLPAVCSMSSTDSLITHFRRLSITSQVSTPDSDLFPLPPLDPQELVERLEQAEWEQEVCNRIIVPDQSPHTPSPRLPPSTPLTTLRDPTPSSHGSYHEPKVPWDTDVTVLHFSPHPRIHFVLVIRTYCVEFETSFEPDYSFVLCLRTGSWNPEDPDVRIAGLFLIGFVVLAVLKAPTAVIHISAQEGIPEPLLICVIEWRRDHVEISTLHFVQPQGEADFLTHTALYAVIHLRRSQIHIDAYRLAHRFDEPTADPIDRLHCVLEDKFPEWRSYTDLRGYVESVSGATFWTLATPLEIARLREVIDESLTFPLEEPIQLDDFDVPPPYDPAALDR
ncbi:hypothetical protein EWM64_g4467 [Hericium alpestre]|uniref:Uncharacterized protein n=1 Tax=Hericium alpestre TaxID=135208 RepID=A0A4Y9ZZC6_9AGAM|nr:hypothetical protein EWM64_g4467 [Hericium alpestre]